MLQMLISLLWILFYLLLVQFSLQQNRTFCADILETSRKFIRRGRGSKDARKAKQMYKRYLLRNIKCSKLLRIVKQQEINQTTRHAPQTITRKG